MFAVNSNFISILFVVELLGRVAWFSTSRELGADFWKMVVASAVTASSGNGAVCRAGAKVQGKFN